MKIYECMTEDVRTVTPDTTIRDAARIMAATDLGAVPVSNKERLVGMLSDRDIVVRAVCRGLGPDTLVRDIMSEEIRYCYDDDEVEDVAKNMGEIQVRRLPVINRGKRLVGIVALSDLTAGAAPRVIGEALDKISRPGGNHSQGAVRAHG
jgi:CBS domain-containing protein